MPPFVQRGGGNFRGSRGASRGATRGATRGGGNFRGGRNQQPYGPPNSIQEIGKYLHTCEGQLVCKVTSLDSALVPYFNGRVFLEDKKEIGKIDEILGPLNQMFVSIKPLDSVDVAQFNEQTKLFIDPNQTLPLDRFLPKPAPLNKTKKKSQTGSRSQRGGFGGRPRGFSKPQRSRGAFGRGGSPFSR